MDTDSSDEEWVNSHSGTEDIDDTNSDETESMVDSNEANGQNVDDDSDETVSLSSMTNNEFDNDNDSNSDITDNDARTVISGSDDSDISDNEVQAVNSGTDDDLTDNEGQEVNRFTDDDHADSQDTHDSQDSQDPNYEGTQSISDADNEDINDDDTEEIRSTADISDLDEEQSTVDASDIDRRQFTSDETDTEPLPEAAEVDEPSQSPILFRRSQTQNQANVQTRSATRALELNAVHGQKLETKTEEPSTSAVDKYDSEEEGDTCSICLEQWTNSGKHRIVALKCGHLFGQSCIQRWIIDTRNKKCPQCNKKATKNDVFPIYAKSIKVLDTSEKEQALKDLENERAKRLEIEMKYTRQKVELDDNTLLIKRLQSELDGLKTTTGVQGNIMNSQRRFNIPVNKKLIQNPARYISVSKQGDCRVMTYCDSLGILIVSMPSPLPLFKGYGVKKIRVGDLSADRFIPLHSKQIRDLAVNPNRNEMLLSVSLDKYIKLTNLNSYSLVQSYECEAPAWCCCWNPDKSTDFFVGTSSGKVVHYSTTKIDGPVDTYNLSGVGPVVGITYITKSSNFSRQGLIVARLNMCSFIEILDNNQSKVKPLHLSGEFNHVSFDQVSRYLLVSCRPKGNHRNARHMLYTLETVNSVSDVPIQIQQKKIYNGSSMQSSISRTAIFSNKDTEETCVLAFDESKSITNLYHTETGQVESIPSAEKVLDIVVIESGAKTVALLTEKNLRLYGWQ